RQQPQLHSQTSDMSFKSMQLQPTLITTIYSFCLYIYIYLYTQEIRLLIKKQNFEAAPYVVMYSLCSEGMNNSPCDTKSHWESDICRLVCFSSVSAHVSPEPCSHMLHCRLGASMETFSQTKSEQIKPTL
uniref:Uncharacterized protein n=1 Tax=Lates calcarifer TaxID=8187 RepID=A0A4W6CHL1_LATCA